MQFDDLLQYVRDTASSQTFRVVADSRQVQEGDIFVAVRGTEGDGGDFIPAAVAAGARYIVCSEEHVVQDIADTSVIRYTASYGARQVLWRLADAYFNVNARFEKQNIRLVGITGTNGKTTVSALLEHLFTKVGRRVGVLGTVSYRWPNADGSQHEEEAPLTTPDSLTLYRLLSCMADAGVDTVLMEVSSHALAQERVGGLEFSGAIFTNLTQDHLDFHGDMEQYFAAKALLFTELPVKYKAMSINVDDIYAQRLMSVCPSALGFTLEGDESKKNVVRGIVEQMSPQGMSLKMEWGYKTWVLHSPLVGAFNASNLLAAQTFALAHGCYVSDMHHLESFSGVCGRLERVVEGHNIFVDYAHTPDALLNVLQALRSTGFKKIITVFGCGGNRDKTKRPLMGKAVAQYSDVAVLTSDNPRFEDPQAIIDDVLPGLCDAGMLVVEVDRRKATQRALELLAQEGDDTALLIAGKGHENCQIVNGVKHHYSDQETVREFV